MTLSEFFQKNKTNQRQFAEKIGVCSRSVAYYLNGRIPSKEVLSKIHQMTQGQVTANDFFHGGES